MAMFNSYVSLTKVTGPCEAWPTGLGGSLLNGLTPLGIFHSLGTVTTNGGKKYLLKQPGKTNTEAEKETNKQRVEFHFHLCVSN